MLKQYAKAVVAAIGSGLAFVVSVLPTDNPWRAVVAAVLALGTLYGVWRIPNTTLTVPSGEPVSKLYGPQ